MDNYFELFGLPVKFGVDAQALRKKYFELSRESHPDFFATTADTLKDDSLEQSIRVNNGYRILNSDSLRVAYVLEFLGVVHAGEKEVLPPAFLMEMMEMNEMIDAMTAANAEAVRTEVNTMETRITEELQHACDAYDASGDKQLLLKVKEAWYKQKYLLRIHEALHKFAHL